MISGSDQSSGQMLKAKKRLKSKGQDGSAGSRWCEDVLVIKIKRKTEENRKDEAVDWADDVGVDVKE